MFGLLAVAATLEAQSPAVAATLNEVSIQVVDSADRPLPSAELTLRGGNGRSIVSRTDSAGLATFKGIPEGPWVLTVRRLGVKPLTLPFNVSAGQSRFTIQTERDVTSLQNVNVVGEKTYSARLDDFERRRRAGIPSATVTREQIEKRAPVKLSRMLREMPGLQIGDSLGSTVALSTRGAKPFRAGRGSVGFGLVPCVMRMSVDGVLLPGTSNIDAIVPNEVHGIEVYYGPARMPPELAGLRTDNWCGLIAIWTRDR